MISKVRILETNPTVTVYFGGEYWNSLYANKMEDLISERKLNL